MGLLKVEITFCLLNSCHFFFFWKVRVLNLSVDTKHGGLDLNSHAVVKKKGHSQREHSSIPLTLRIHNISVC